MSNYFFVQRASSCGGQYVAIFPVDQSVKAFDYIANDSNNFLSLYEGEWDGSGELPVPGKLKRVTTNKDNLKL